MYGAFDPSSSSGKRNVVDCWTGTLTAPLRGSLASPAWTAVVEGPGPGARRRPPTGAPERSGVAVSRGLARPLARLGMRGHRRAPLQAAAAARRPPTAVRSAFLQGRRV